MVVIFARTVFDIRDFYYFQEVKPSPLLFTTLDFTWRLIDEPFQIRRQRQQKTKQTKREREKNDTFSFYL